MISGSPRRPPESAGAEPDQARRIWHSGQGASAHASALGAGV